MTISALTSGSKVKLSQPSVAHHLHAEIGVEQPLPDEAGDDERQREGIEEDGAEGVLEADVLIEKTASRKPMTRVKIDRQHAEDPEVLDGDQPARRRPQTFDTGRGRRSVRRGRSFELVKDQNTVHSRADDEDDDGRQDHRDRGDLGAQVAEAAGPGRLLRAISPMAIRCSTEAGAQSAAGPELLGNGPQGRDGRRLVGAAMTSAKRFWASSGVMSVAEEFGEQILDLLLRVLRDELVGRRNDLALGQDVEALLHAVVGGGRQSTSARTGSEPFLRLKATWVFGVDQQRGQTFCALDFSSSCSGRRGVATSRRSSR